MTTPHTLHTYTLPDQRRVCVMPDKVTLAESVASLFVSETSALLRKQHAAHIVLTGGTMGIAALRAINAHPARDTVDWSRVHFWWGDERWLPAHHPDRNDEQASDALLDHIAVQTQHIHRFPNTDSGLTLDQAAATYAHEISTHASDKELAPHFDITFLGVGPDGHIASLFPNRSEITDSAPVIAVRDSPKPPPERLSLGRDVINSSVRVWLVVAGADKSDALHRATTSNNIVETPAASVRGKKDTIFFADSEAANKLSLSTSTSTSTSKP